MAMSGGVGHRTEGGEGGEGAIPKLRNNKKQSLGPEWSISEVGTPLPHNSDKPHGLVASNNNKTVYWRVVFQYLKNQLQNPGALYLIMPR